MSKVKPMHYIIVDAKRAIVAAEKYDKLASTSQPLDAKIRNTLRQAGQQMDCLAKHLIGLIMRCPQINQETKMDLVAFCTDNKAHKLFGKE